MICPASKAYGCKNCEIKDHGQDKQDEEDKQQRPRRTFADSRYTARSDQPGHNRDDEKDNGKPEHRPEHISRCKHKHDRSPWRHAPNALFYTTHFVAQRDKTDDGIRAKDVPHATDSTLDSRPQRNRTEAMTDALKYRNGPDVAEAGKDFLSGQHVLE